MKRWIACSAVVATVIVTGCWLSYTPHYEADAPHYIPTIVGVVASMAPALAGGHVYVFDDGRTATLPQFTTNHSNSSIVDPGKLLLADNSPSRPWLFALPPATSQTAPAGCFMYLTTQLYVVGDRANAFHNLAFEGPGPPIPSYLSLPIADGFTTEPVEQGHINTLCVDRFGRAMKFAAYGID